MESLKKQLEVFRFRRGTSSPVYVSAALLDFHLTSKKGFPTFIAQKGSR